MNKARRHEIKMLKFKKRVDLIKARAYRTLDGNFNCYRTTGNPCSCAMCSPHREIPRRPKHSDLVKMAQYTQE